MAVRPVIAPRQQLRLLTQGIEDRISAYLPGNLARRVAASVRPPLDSLTNWYTALKLLEILPDRIPALLENILEILNSPCPIRGAEINPETGTYNKVWNTHVLYLLPDGSINDLLARIDEYVEKHLEQYAKRNCGLQWENDGRQYLDLRVNTRVVLGERCEGEEGHQRLFSHREEQYQWVLLSRDILPGSRDQTCEYHAAMVRELNERSSAAYRVPSMRDVVGALFLHEIATREKLYLNNNDPNDPRRLRFENITYTRLQDIVDGCFWLVGGFERRGLKVDIRGNFWWNCYRCPTLGIAVCQYY